MRSSALGVGFTQGHTSQRLNASDMWRKVGKPTIRTLIRIKASFCWGPLKSSNLHLDNPPGEYCESISNDIPIHLSNNDT